MQSANKSFKDFVKIVDKIKKNNLSGKSLDINGKLFQKKILNQST